MSRVSAHFMFPRIPLSVFLCTAITALTLAGPLAAQDDVPRNLDDAGTPPLLTPDTTDTTVAPSGSPASDANLPPATISVSPAAWSTFKGDQQRTGSSNARLALPLNMLWRHDTDAPPGKFATSPIVTGPSNAPRIVFAAGNTVFCVDAQTGASLWQVDAKGKLRAPLTLVSGGEMGATVIAATSKGLVMAIRPSDGLVSWKTEMKASVLAVAPVLAHTPKGDRLLVCTNAGPIKGLSLQDGAIDADVSIKLGTRSTSAACTPVINPAGTQMYVLGRDRVLYCISLTDLSEDFHATIRGLPTLTPALLGRTLVVAIESTLWGLDDNYGQAVWHIALDGRVTASPSGHVDSDGTAGTAYVGTVPSSKNTGSLYAVDLSDGTVLWKTKIDAQVSGTPLVLNDSVIVGTNDGQLCGVNRADGTVLWRYQLQTRRVIQVEDSDANTNRNNNNNRNLTGANRNVDDANNVNDASDVKKTKVTHSVVRSYGVSSAPAVVDNRLFLLADNASLYAFTDDLLDAEAPRVIKTVLSVRDSRGGQAKIRLSKSTTPPVIPGRSPLSVEVTLADLGSGIDPASLVVTLNGAPIDPAKITYRAATGKLVAKLLENAADQTSSSLEEGKYQIGVAARDFRGNALTAESAFTADKSVKAPISRYEKDNPKTGTGTNTKMPGASPYNPSNNNRSNNRTNTNRTNRRR